MYKYLRTQLTSHPASVNQTWGDHCIEALCYSIQALTAGSVLLVHAFIPCLFEDFGEDCINSLSRSIKETRMQSRWLQPVENDEHPLSHSYHE